MGLSRDSAWLWRWISSAIMAAEPLDRLHGRTRDMRRQRDVGQADDAGADLAVTGDGGDIAPLQWTRPNW